MSTLVDVFGANKKKNIMADTWGHTYPRETHKYQGKIWFATGGGTCSFLGRDFPNLDGSPMEYDLVCSVATNSDELFGLDWDDIGLYEVECTLHFFKDCDDKYFSGEEYARVIKKKLKTLKKVDL